MTTYATSDQLARETTNRRKQDTIINGVIAALEVRVAALEGPVVIPPGPEPPTPGTTAKVGSVVALLDALTEDSLSEIVLANGRYPISIAAAKKPDSLWIGKRFAARTNPVLVRAETLGGVTFDGQQEKYWGGLTTAEGAHDQTWRGFRWVNGEATGTGVIVVGGYQNMAPTHRMTLDDCEVTEFWGSDTGKHGHGIYISQTFGGPHTDLTLNRFKVTDVGAHIGGGIHFYHDSYDGEVATLPNYFNAHNTTIRGAVLTGVDVGFYVWAHTIKGLLIEDSKVVNARYAGVCYERGRNVTFRRVVTTGSKYGGIRPTSYIPGGPYSYPNIPEFGEDKIVGPKMVGFEDCDFR